MLGPRENHRLPFSKDHQETAAGLGPIGRSKKTRRRARELSAWDSVARVRRVRYRSRARAGIAGGSRTTRLMKPERLATQVALHPFLAGMSRNHLALLTERAIEARFKNGEVVIREGEFADRFYLIETGKIVLESGTSHGAAVIVDTIGAGDLLGWSWMFPPYLWQFTARAIKPTSALFFYGTILREYCEKDRSLGYELLKRSAAVMIRRLQAARGKMLAVSSRQVTLASAAGSSVR